MTSEDLLLSYQVNVFGVIKTIQQCYPKLNESSHIVNISSIGGYQGSIKFPGLTAYSSAKAAICNITEMLAEELRKMENESDVVKILTDLPVSVKVDHHQDVEQNLSSDPKPSADR